MGLSVALQARDPQIESELNTFRWEVSLATAPRPEPVTSDTPSPALAAPPPEARSLQSHTVEPAMPPPAQHLSRPSSRIRRTSPVAEARSAPATTGESSLTNPPLKPMPAQPHRRPHRPEAPLPDAILAHFQPPAQEQFHQMPFTHGTEATVPPPVPHTIEPAEHVRQPGRVQDPLVLQRPRVSRGIVRRLNTQPDYGWLVQDLRTKLERLKFYPQMARVHKWEGKVVIQMKILEDGHLLDAAVEESSGYSLLDQTALDIIRRASPLKLAHPLVAKIVTLSVPLTFQLE